MPTINAQDLNQQLDASLWPRFTDVNQTDPHRITFDFSLDARVCYLAGHFPAQAVLPGVVQVHWAGQLAQRYFASKGFTRLHKVKFNQIIVPGDSLSLTLVFVSSTGKLSFTYSDQQQRYSSGIMTFEAADE